MSTGSVKPTSVVSYTATNHGKPWSVSDEFHLLKQADRLKWSGCPCDEAINVLALNFRRTPRAIYCMLLRHDRIEGEFCDYR